MPVAKSKPSNSMELVKQDRSDSLDTFIRRAGGKEPYPSFPRPENGPVQLFQLLHAFDQPELPGWPLLTPLKVQMQKCDKCFREFCSPINYRRHIRVHRRSRKIGKESGKDRDLLGAFWDKLSEDEAKEIVSFKNVKLEEFTISSVVMALTMLIQKPGFSALPQYFLRAGSDLLDIIQARPSRFPISSQELFSILDDASERTFLCGTAASMQKYVFDGETGKNALEAKNVVACTSFFLEHRLIKAWLADKDAEALRCQKLLVEEEEAAKRRQAELLERKRRKKLRQKEQGATDQRDKEIENIKESDSTTAEERQHQAELSSPFSTASGFDTQRREITPTEDSSFLESIEVSKTNQDTKHETHMMPSNCAYNNDKDNGHTTEKRVGRRHMVVSRWKIPSKPQWGMANGSHVPKLGGMQKNGTNREARTLPLVTATKVWSRKGENLKTVSQHEDVIQLGQSKKSEVLIGSISVTLGNCGSHRGDGQNDCTEEHETPKKVQGKPSTLPSTVKLWRPVSRHRKSKGPTCVENGDGQFEMKLIGTTDIDNKDGKIGHTLTLVENNVHQGRFNSRGAKAFLAQRWKEVTSAEHVTLVLSPEVDIHGNTQSRLVGMVTKLESSNGGSAKPKFRMKPENGAKVKYIPKQRTVG